MRIEITGISSGWLTVFEVLFATWGVTSAVSAVLDVRLRLMQRKLAKLRGADKEGKTDE